MISPQQNLCYSQSSPKSQPSAQPDLLPNIRFTILDDLDQLNDNINGDSALDNIDENLSGKDEISLQELLYDQKAVGIKSQQDGKFDQKDRNTDHYIDKSYGRYQFTASLGETLMSGSQTGTKTLNHYNTSNNVTSDKKISRQNQQPQLFIKKQSSNLHITPISPGLLRKANRNQDLKEHPSSMLQRQKQSQISSQLPNLTLPKADQRTQQQHLFPQQCRQFTMIRKPCMYLIQRTIDLTQEPDIKHFKDQIENMLGHSNFQPLISGVSTATNKRDKQRGNDKNNHYSGGYENSTEKRDYRLFSKAVETQRLKGKKLITSNNNNNNLTHAQHIHTSNNAGTFNRIPTTPGQHSSNGRVKR